MDGDPTEGALLTLGLKAGWTRVEREACPRTDAIPFESEHRFMATLHHDHEGRGFVYVKGAPERLLAHVRLAAHRRGRRPAAGSPYWHRRVEELAARGQRVLAVAAKAAAADHRELSFADVEQGLTLLGLFGLIDPPREEAIAAIAACRSAGIRVKMITGDHAATARAIARQLGLANDRDVMTGAELASPVGGRAAPPRAASRRLRPRQPRAQAAPGRGAAGGGRGGRDDRRRRQRRAGAQARRRRRRHGQKGTEAAKEAAEMVLADDNFASIVAAVEEGRTVYDNLKKSILFILPTNGGEAPDRHRRHRVRRRAADHAGPDPLGQHGDRHHPVRRAGLRARRAGYHAAAAAPPGRADPVALPGVAGRLRVAAVSGRRPSGCSSGPRAEG